MSATEKRCRWLVSDLRDFSDADLTSEAATHPHKCVTEEIERRRRERRNQREREQRRLKLKPSTDVPAPTNDERPTVTSCEAPETETKEAETMNSVAPEQNEATETSPAIGIRAYSHVEDNKGRAVELPDWPAFVAYLRKRLEETAPSKNGLKLIGPHVLRAGGKRNLEGVELVTLGAIDIDRDIPDVETLLCEIRYMGWAAAVHTSPRDPQPDTRKLRAYFPLSRPCLPHECGPLRRVIGAMLRVSIDTNALDSSRFLYVGAIKGTPAREVWEIEGAPLPVDEMLAIELAPEPSAERKAGPTPSVPKGAPADDDDPVVALVRHEWETGERHPINRALASKLAQWGWEDVRIAGIFRALGCDRAGLGVEHRVREAIKASHQAREYHGSGKGEQPPGWKTLCERFGVEGAEAIKAAAKDPRMPDNFRGVWNEAAAVMEERSRKRLEKDLADQARKRAEAAAKNQSKPGNTNGNGETGPSAEPFNPAAETAEQPDESAGHDPAVDHVIEHLAKSELSVYQRAGLLVTITREAHSDQEIVRAVGTPTIRTIQPARLKEIIRTTAGLRLAPLAGDVIARGEWAHIRPLDAIVSYPVLRRDGSILTTSGYDSATRTLAEMRVTVDVPDEPTLADARAALALLTDLVGDFPFESPAHRSAWLAALLTVPARPAIDGPTPMLLLDASARGSGKTMLADLISIIATGDDATRRTAPETAEEWRKVIYAMLLAGDPICLIDNVTRMLASAALDAMLTGTTYKDRVLGVSEERSIAVRTVMIASANNCRVSSDLVRRSLHCRIDPNLERPELRSGFKIPDLLAHVRRERAALLGAALTIVRAYAVAGRPAVTARPMGSYGAWCRVVRDALVWAGGGDPAETQDALREDADVERDELRDLLTAWHGLLGDTAVTVRELLDATRDHAPGARVNEPGGKFGGGTDEQRALVDALRGIMPSGVEPSTHTVGKRLQSLRSGRSGKLVLRQRGTAHGGAKRWQVAAE